MPPASSNKMYTCKCGQVFNLREMRKHLLTDGRKEKGQHGYATAPVAQTSTPAPEPVTSAPAPTPAPVKTPSRLIKKPKPLPNDSQPKRILPFTTWKLLIGLGLILASIPAGAIYFADIQNMFAAFIMIFTFAPGAWFIYWSFQTKTSGYVFNSTKKYTGRENAIILFARKGPDGKDLPLGIRFAELKNPPRHARLHLIRNYNKHFYELYNNTKTHKLEPVVLPDKKAFPPELFQIPAAMQPYKDAIEFSPGTLFQKLAPGLILAAMAIVGIFMVATTTNAGG